MDILTEQVQHKTKQHERMSKMTYGSNDVDDIPF